MNPRATLDRIRDQRAGRARLDRHDALVRAVVEYRRLLGRTRRAFLRQQPIRDRVAIAEEKAIARERVRAFAVGRLAGPVGSLLDALAQEQHARVINIAKPEGREAYLAGGYAYRSSHPVRQRVRAAWLACLAVNGDPDARTALYAAAKAGDLYALDAYAAFIRD